MLSAEEKKARKAASGKKYYEANKDKIAAARKKKYHEGNKEKVLAQAAKYREDNKEKEAARKKKYNEANKEKIAARDKKYNEANKEKRSMHTRVWCINNPGRKSAINAKRRAAKLRATPPWSDLVYIKSIYEKAAEAGMHVDHIIPLQGDLVCGLHVEHNLQLLTLSENSSKGNRFDGETYVHILP